MSPTTFEERGRRPRQALGGAAHRRDRRASIPRAGCSTSRRSNAPLPVTEIFWDAADALPFPLCVSVAGAAGTGDQRRARQHRARRSRPDGARRAARHGARADACAGPRRLPARSRANAPKASRFRARFRPALASAPLTQGFDLAARSARCRSREDEALVAGERVARSRSARRLAADHRAEGRARVRRRPTGPRAATCSPATATPPTSSWRRRTTASRCCVSATTCTASGPIDGHRVHARPTASATALPAMSAPRRSPTSSATSRACSTRCTNPMPAAGGIDPEDIEAARRDAPEAFRTQERAVTAADYAAAAERRADVQRAAATFRWTGSWHTVFVTADRFGGARGRRALRGAAAPPPRALSHGRLRPRGRRAALRARSTSRCTSA